MTELPRRRFLQLLGAALAAAAVPPLVRSDKWHRFFFYRNKRPEMVLFIDGELQDGIKSELVAVSTNKFGGAGVTLDGGVSSLVDVNLDGEFTIDFWFNPVKNLISDVEIRIGNEGLHRR